MNLNADMNSFMNEIKFLLVLGKIWAIGIVNAWREAFFSIFKFFDFAELFSSLDTMLFPAKLDFSASAGRLYLPLLP